MKHFKNYILIRKRNGEVVSAHPNFAYPKLLRRFRWNLVLGCTRHVAWFVSVECNLKFETKLVKFMKSHSTWDVLEVTSVAFMARLSSPPRPHRLRTGSGDHPTSYPVSTGVFPRGKAAEREADHSPSSSAKVKMRGAIPRLPDTSSWRGS